MNPGLCSRQYRQKRKLTTVLPHMSLISEFDVSSLGPSALQVECALQRFSIASAPTMIDHQRRIDIINKINRAINDALESQGLALTVLPFGSFVSGLYRACRCVEYG